MPEAITVIPVFDSWTLRSYSVRLAIEDRSRLALRAGTFDAYRVDVTGDLWNLPQIWYVSADPPRRVLRAEWPNGTVIEAAR